MERIGRIIKNMAEGALDLLFPRRCPFCRKISEGICDTCRETYRPVAQPYCFRCGRPLAEGDREFCGACQERVHHFDRGRALYLYEGGAKEAVLAVKYQNRREYLEYFAREMASYLGEEIKGWEPEILLPIPMHARDRRKRGFNQAQILADHLSRELELPLCDDVLLKVRKTADQKELDYGSRRQNLKNAFDVNEKYLDARGKLPWRRILLADDVYTTGSTLDEAAMTLKKYGAEQVFFVTVCTVP